MIASGDGSKGKSECATSFPECAKAAIDRGWTVEIHSWKHSTSLEWAKMEKLYPQQLSVHFLDRYGYNDNFCRTPYNDDRLHKAQTLVVFWLCIVYRWILVFIILKSVVSQWIIIKFLLSVFRYLFNVTFVDGKYGRKCKQFTTDWYVKTRGIN